GIIGYDFGMFRAETEVSFRRAEESEYTVPGTVYDNSRVGGGAESLSFMLNGLVDFGPDDGFQGFIGGGVGVARTKIAAIVNPLFPDHSVTDTDTRFAWQLLAGVRAPLNDKIDIGLKYRFFNQYHIDLVGDDGRDARTRFRSHSL